MAKVFDIGDIRNKLLRRAEDKISLLQEKSEPQHVIEQEVDKLLQKMIGDHERNVEGDREDVVKMAISVYKSHLRDLINKDVYTL